MKLLDICETIVDCPHSTAKDEGTGYPLIRTPNVGKGRLKLAGVHRVSENVYNQRNERAVPKVDDLILAREAPVGNVAIIRKGQQVCLGQRTVLIRPNKKYVDPDYLVYYLLSPELQHKLLSSANGATVSHLNMSSIRSLEVQVPEIEVQKRIGAILARIDDKIELNSTINENLEQQAQALFKAWFVDFEPFGGVMPDDWRMGTLSEICGYSKDKIDIDNLTLDSYYSTENMQPNRQGAVQATTLPTIKQTTACKKGDVLISNIRPYFKKILYCFSDCGCSTDVLCFVPNKTDYSAFLYCALYADKFFDYMVAGSKGTKMPRGDKQQIMVYPICIPSAEYIEKFNQAVASMLETVYTNRIEANNLANLRDTLLPKLMNGEIDVSAVKI
ncbi:MAG: restriction endonuclease subunit S [Oscillospiraceae bacterium]|nr:MAG: restriction endonuclease subunit S [Oscillospiraceae bacterium]